MKRVFLLMTGLAALLIPGQAIAQEACGGSYIILPDGSCINLSYMSVLSNSRSGLTEMNELYQDELELNAALNSSTLYLLNESEEDRDARYASLVETAIIRNAVAADAEDLEATLFPIHTRVLGVIGDVFAP